jgi:hypothetical protein
MVEITARHAEPQIQRKERQPDPLVLPHVTELVSPNAGSRIGTRDDDVTERDRAEAAQSQDQMGETAVAHVEKAALAHARQSARQQTNDVTDRISVMRDEQRAKGQGIDATAWSIPSSTRSREVNDVAKRSVRSFALWSKSTAVTP